MSNTIDLYSYYCFAFTIVLSGATLEKITVASDLRISCALSLGACDAKSGNSSAFKTKKEFETLLNLHIN